MRKTIILGISGGIAACKAPQLISLLKKNHFNVQVITTSGAEKMIDNKELETLSQNPVYTNLFAKDINTEKILKERTIEHIALANTASLVVVAPATANVIAKIANGIADDYLTTVILAATCPVVICPSMNVYMWNNPVTQENIKKLHKRGFIVIHPDSGMLACGYEGEGKLAKIEKIVQEVYQLVKKGNSLKGKKYIVTAGGTAEPIDNVRYIANHASGKMGAAIADSLFLRGAEVLFICSEKSKHPRFIKNIKTFITADDLESILEKEIPQYDAIFHTAAVSDFIVENKTQGKISSNNEIILTLKPRKKIINFIKQWNPEILLFGFKASWNVSDERLIEIAKDKMEESHADAIIANDVGRENQGFGVDNNAIIVVSKENIRHFPLASKQEIAENIIDNLL
jgi:phosphopantothenoylcysteine decarboxylase/phosphopantothenate--cysteine ligase